MKRELSANEQKKEFLNKYQKSKRTIYRLEMQLEAVRADKMFPSCMIGDGMPHSHDPSDLSEYAAKVDEINREIKKEKYESVVICHKVRSAIEQVDGENEKDVLTYRYIFGYEWEKICVKMNYSWKHIHRIHGKALKSFLIPNEKEDIE